MKGIQIMKRHLVWLASALATLSVSMASAHLPESSRPPADGVELGLCSGEDARSLFFDTVEEVIVPGLERHGIPARRAWNNRGGVRDVAA